VIEEGALRSRARGRCRLPLVGDPLGHHLPRDAPSTNPYLWVDTKAILEHLSMSRATLDRLHQEGVLVEKRHFIKKNPTASRGVFLWNVQRCDLALDRI
jgi:hypothetical protein